MWEAKCNVGRNPLKTANQHLLFGENKNPCSKYVFSFMNIHSSIDTLYFYSILRWYFESRF